MLRFAGERRVSATARLIALRHAEAAARKHLKEAHRIGAGEQEKLIRNYLQNLGRLFAVSDEVRRFSTRTLELTGCAI